MITRYVIECNTITLNGRNRSYSGGNFNCIKSKSIWFFFRSNISSRTTEYCCWWIFQMWYFSDLWISRKLLFFCMRALRYRAFSKHINVWWYTKFGSSLYLKSVKFHNGKSLPGVVRSFQRIPISNPFSILWFYIHTYIETHLPGIV